MAKNIEDMRKIQHTSMPSPTPIHRVNATISANSASTLTSNTTTQKRKRLKSNDPLHETADDDGSAAPTKKKATRKSPPKKSHPIKKNRMPAPPPAHSDDEEEQHDDFSRADGHTHYTHNEDPPPHLDIDDPPLYAHTNNDNPHPMEGGHHDRSHTSITIPRHNLAAPTMRNQQQPPTRAIYNRSLTVQRNAPLIDNDDNE